MVFKWCLFSKCLYSKKGKIFLRVQDPQRQNPTVFVLVYYYYCHFSAAPTQVSESWSELETQNHRPDVGVVLKDKKINSGNCNSHCKSDWPEIRRVRPAKCAQQKSLWTITATMDFFGNGHRLYMNVHFEFCSLQMKGLRTYWNAAGSFWLCLVSCFGVFDYISWSSSASTEETVLKVLSAHKIESLIWSSFDEEEEKEVKCFKILLVIIIISNVFETLPVGYEGMQRKEQNHFKAGMWHSHVESSH